MRSEYAEQSPRRLHTKMRAVAFFTCDGREHYVVVVSMKRPEGMELSPAVSTARVSMLPDRLLGGTSFTKQRQNRTEQMKTAPFFGEHPDRKFLAHSLKNRLL